MSGSWIERAAAAAAGHHVVDVSARILAPAVEEGGEEGEEGEEAQSHSTPP